MGILAVDIGTGSIRASVFDDNLKSLSLSRVRLELGFEQDPESIYRSMLEACRSACRMAKTSSVEAIVLSSQMHGLLCLGGDGKPLTNLHTYLDTRPAEVLPLLEEKVEGYRLYRKTGCPPLFIYPLTKLLWLNQFNHKVFREARWFLSAKDYLVYKLTGEPYIDKSTASGSQLLDIERLVWSNLSLSLAEIDESKLPILYDGEKPLTRLQRSVASSLGLSEECTLILGASDAALHSLGVGSMGVDVAALNLGTSGAIRVSSNRPILDRSEAMRFFCYYIGYGLWIPGGAVNNAGLALRWFIDRVLESEGPETYRVLTEEIERVPPGSGGIVILPFLSGERFPVRDPYARSVFFGLTLSHGRAHIARGLMEASIYGLRWILEAMGENGLNPRVIRVGGGGARSKVWRKIQADILGLPIELVEFEEASLMGAAILGAEVLGYYPSLDEAVKATVKIAEVESPDSSSMEVYEKYYRLYRKLYTTLASLFVEIHRLTEDFRETSTLRRSQVMKE